MFSSSTISLERVRKILWRKRAREINRIKSYGPNANERKCGQARIYLLNELLEEFKEIK